MADLSSCFTSPKEEKKRRTLPDSSTTSDGDTDVVPNDSDCWEFYLNKISDKAHLRLKAPVVDWRKVSETYVHLKGANIPEAHDSDRVHVLLGTDYAHLNASSRSICGGDMKPNFTRMDFAIWKTWKSNFFHVRKNVTGEKINKRNAPRRAHYFTEWWLPQRKKLFKVLATKTTEQA